MLPLSLWQLHARELPDELAVFPKASSFSLPGAKALEDFADLLGETETASEEAQPEEESAPFSLPAMLPDSLDGSVSLRREIDFGGLHGDRAMLEIDHIIGRGRILLGEETLCAFDSARFSDEALSAAYTMTARPCMLAIDLSHALKLGRRETLIIEFDDARPAGLPGPVMLHVTSGAYLSKLSILPDARQKTISVNVAIVCTETGCYVLRAQGVLQNNEPMAARETTLFLRRGEARAVHFSFSLPASSFAPGSPCSTPAVKLQLFSRDEEALGDGMLCDSATLMCGYPAPMPETWLPLDRAVTFANPQKTVDALKSLHIPAVSLDVPAPDGLYRALSRAGIAVRQFMPDDHPLREAIARFPCVCLSTAPATSTVLSPEASAWQLCSMVSAPRTLDETLSAKELLREASGMPLNPQDAGIREALLWLRALSVRLRAEAARQHRYHGALCAADEQTMPDITSALQTAFAPLHLSALPLCGAWWTGTRFSASLEAFIPADTYKEDLRAQAVLEDSEGAEMAFFEAPCRAAGGYLGVIEAALPDHPCVLELTTRLLSGSEVIEESTMPVYVGDRGQLEAAFG